MSSNYKLSNIASLLSYMITTLSKLKMISDLFNHVKTFTFRVYNCYIQVKKHLKL